MDTNGREQKDEPQMNSEQIKRSEMREAVFEEFICVNRWWICFLSSRSFVSIRA